MTTATAPTFARIVGDMLTRARAQVHRDRATREALGVDHWPSNASNHMGEHFKTGWINWQLVPPPRYLAPDYSPEDEYTFYCAGGQL